MTNLLPWATVPSDTFYTHAPDWTWLIVVYFFVGGIAGGSAFLGALLDLFGSRADRPVARIGHLIAAPLMPICGVLLIWDLNRPERFWHMMIQSETGFPMFKYWSPISFGAWGVGLFSIFSGLVFLGVLAEMGILPGALRSLHEGTLGRVLTALSGLSGIFVAGYTGMLLADTNRPLWGDTTLLGVLFLFSGVSAAAALMTILGLRRGHPATVHWLGRMDFYSSLLELVVLVVLLISLGAVAREVLGNGWGVLLGIGVILAGILVPMAIHWRPRLLGRMSVPSAAALVLLGSFLLRTVIVMASEGA
ncbi:MAG: hypothetical protein AVDCRST_MAG73-33 [uncultured Thermomicrobiales bacterium]|uniref:Polysulfide reductase n=1 Tax=uncultured Thermomicrobiales bacterium TaxID=1645740 RepID=A0A6J4TAH7_9BACT|nr:MAG: hypothetical protein AVDCRST_MAG73-33 [uncultured Thermomicrobiales bacterium]